MYSFIADNGCKPLYKKFSITASRPICSILFQFPEDRNEEVESWNYIVIFMIRILKQNIVLWMFYQCLYFMLDMQ